MTLPRAVRDGAVFEAARVFSMQHAQPAQVDEKGLSRWCYYTLRIKGADTLIFVIVLMDGISEKEKKHVIHRK